MPFLTAAAPLNKAAKKEKVSVEKIQKAIFAGGCFWCMEKPFEQLEGVSAVLSGYCGGKEENPTYEAVSNHETGHAEAVEVTFDSSKISYKQLLDVFWMNIDPNDPNGQFVDQGPQYRSGIFYLTDEQKKIAEASKAELEKTGRFKVPIVTEITPATKFWPAEDYHQDYYKKNPVRYKFYRSGSGRDKFLDKVWGKERKH